MASVLRFFQVSAVRTPVGKAPNGALRTTRPDEMGAVVIKELLNRVPALKIARWNFTGATEY